MTMITQSYLGETIEYSSLHACRSTLEDPTHNCESRHTIYAKWFGRGLEEELKNSVMGAFAGIWCGKEHEFYPKREAMRAEKFEF